MCANVQSIGITLSSEASKKDVLEVRPHDECEKGQSAYVTRQQSLRRRGLPEVWPCKIEYLHSTGITHHQCSKRQDVLEVWPHDDCEKMQSAGIAHTVSEDRTLQKCGSLILNVYAL